MGRPSMRASRRAQLVGRAAQPAELLGKHVGGERMFPGLRQDLRRLDAAGGARVGAGRNAQAPADARFDRQIQRHAARDRAAV